MKKILFTICFVSLIKFSFGQSCHNVKELLRKRHTISGMTYGHPYTMFDRHNKLNLDSMISNIRRRITNEYNPKIDSAGPVYIAYSKIYNNAKLNMPLDNGIINGTDKSALAYWAKNNAFVFLVGVDGNGKLLDSLAYTASRDSFRDRAKDAFNYLIGKVEPHAPLSISISNSDDTNLQHYSRSLIYWLQAYDLLKAAYEVSELRNSNRNPWGFGDADRNTDGDCGVRRKLRDYARNVYTRSKDFDGIVEHATGWKKNHGIACASSLLMAAQVLNDAGTETNLLAGVWGSIKNWFGSEEVEYAPYYSPIYWNELGQKGLDDNIFDGKHWWPADNVPQSPRNKTPNSYSVFAEGPGYANYGLFDCGIPAMIAQRNLYPKGSDEPFMKKKEITNIFNWYNSLLTENNTQPSIDNSKVVKNGILAITGIDKFSIAID